MKHYGSVLNNLFDEIRNKSNIISYYIGKFSTNYNALLYLSFLGLLSNDEFEYLLDIKPEWSTDINNDIIFYTIINSKL